MTNKDQLNRLKEPWRSQAFENADLAKGYSQEIKNDWLDSGSSSLKITLMQAFIFDDTKQGKDYWKDIYLNPQNYTNDESI